MTVRCKFICNEVSRQYLSNSKYQWRYKFNAVYGTSEENKKYWSATPSGALEFQCVTADMLFEVGREYYLDINLAAQPIETQEVGA